MSNSIDNTNTAMGAMKYIFINHAERATKCFEEFFKTMCTCCDTLCVARTHGNNKQSYLNNLNNL